MHLLHFRANVTLGGPGTWVSDTLLGRQTELQAPGFNGGEGLAVSGHLGHQTGGGKVHSLSPFCSTF